jgi:hypothetical protein
MSDEAKKEGRDWTADIVPVAVYSLVIFVLLFLYVISPASPPLALRLGSSAGALPGIMHHPDALPQRDPRPWPALRAGILLRSAEDAQSKKIFERRGYSL